MTITDAMVEAAWRAFNSVDDGVISHRKSMRAALEAAYPDLLRENEALRKLVEQWRDTATTVGRDNDH